LQACSHALENGPTTKADENELGNGNEAVVQLLIENGELP
jgi:hypothetical protein